jgi:hypothetical protein
VTRHRSAYIVHGMGLSLPAKHTRPRRADKAKGAMAIRGSAPTGVTSADTRQRLIPGMKANMLMARRGRAERLKEIFSGPSMVVRVWDSIGFSKGDGDGPEGMDLIFEV